MGTEPCDDAAAGSGPHEERSEGNQGAPQAVARCPRYREAGEHDVPGHVRHEHASETEDADRINETCSEREQDQESRQWAMDGMGEEAATARRCRDSHGYPFSTTDESTTCPARPVLGPCQFTPKPGPCPRIVDTGCDYAASCSVAV